MADINKKFQKKSEIIDGYLIKYHANGKTMWSKGKVLNGKPEGYWEWYRPDGTKKRSGFFNDGEAVGEWVTYNNSGKIHKVTQQPKPYNAKIPTDSEFCPS